jgi:hypothetical protein
MCTLRPKSGVPFNMYASGLFKTFAAQIKASAPYTSITGTFEFCCLALFASSIHFIILCPLFRCVRLSWAGPKLLQTCVKGIYAWNGNKIRKYRNTSMIAEAWLSVASTRAHDDITVDVLVTCKSGGAPM